jgi:adenosylmethionine-8-amino-7-oxononanoate aminotransferase
LLINVSHISPCYEYILREETETAYEYGQRMAQELEDEILRLGPETVMAFMAEPVVGATLGAVPAVDGYFQKIRKICDQYGVLLILDEVMCGMGRTGYLYACDAEQVSPDILCIAKGLGAGYQPIGAMLCTSEIYQCIETGSGLFQHGHTYLGHPVAAAAARAVVKKLVENNLVDRATEKGKKLSELLESKFSQHPNVGDIRGRGLFQGLEFVEDREAKQPFGSGHKFAARLKAKAFEAGLICYPMSGTRDGKNGDHVLLAPPFIIEDSQLDELVEKLDSAITKTLGQPA